jgi:hypothetical protein
MPPAAGAVEVTELAAAAQVEFGEVFAAAFEVTKFGASAHIEEMRIGGVPAPVVTRCLQNHGNHSSSAEGCRNDEIPGTPRVAGDVGSGPVLRTAVLDGID